MKKIGIITITDYLNYGNRLQNYASQELLKSLGFEVESIINYPVKEKNENESIQVRLKNAIKLTPLVLINKTIEKIENKLNSKKYNSGQEAKSLSFKEYSRKHMVETDFVVTTHNIPENLGDKYDYFVVGSDQIWNPNIRYGSPVDFLTFAPQNKRVALAPSFGVSDIPEKYAERYKSWILEMSHLSVREQAGANLIKKLCGREALVLVDPTLMLTREQWLNVAEPARQKPANKKYLLTYFIGAVSKQRKQILNDLAAKNNLELVQMKSLDDIKRYDANPGEFIDYVNSSTLVCTDSFHAIIFSMQMEKPFIVFDREGKSAPMSSRIDTLLSKFKFEDRKLSTMINKSDIFDIDFKHVPEILKTERKKVTDYLNNALGLNKIAN